MSHTVIQLDNLNEHDWQKITTSYHADKTTKSEVEILYDNGLTERLKYSEQGRVISRTFLDIDDTSRNPPPEIVATGGIFNWSSMELLSLTSPLMGTYLQSNVKFDNGIEDSTYALIGNYSLESLNVTFDVQGNYNWATKVSRDNGFNGHNEFALTYYDNGVYRREYFDLSGDRKEFFEADLLDVMPWSVRTINYLAEGSQVYTRNYLDNGVINVRLEEDGVLNWRRSFDNGDKYNWESKAHYYNPDRSLKNSEVIYDDGRETSISYSDGKLSVQSTSDVKNIYSWERVETNFDTNGRKIKTQKTDDDGVKTDTFFFSNGRVAVNKHDFKNAKSWEKIHVSFDENRELVLRAVFEDDGDILASYFDQGARTMQVFEDISDSHTWYARVNSYDKNGGLVDTVYYDSYQELVDSIDYIFPFHVPVGEI